MPIELFIKNLIPVVDSIMEDKNWRNRRDVISSFPFIAASLNKEYFTEIFFKYLLLSLRDRVYEVRVSSTKALSEIVSSFGVEWAEKNVFPKLSNLSKD